MSAIDSAPSPALLVPKICGFDVELANIDPTRDDKGSSASTTLLRALDVMQDGIAAGPRSNRTQDSGRVFLPASGSSHYIDLCHLEQAGPEVRDGWSLAASFHAMLGLAREAARAVNTKRAEPGWIRVHANNSDGHGASWGGHNSFLLHQNTYRRLFNERMHELSWLASAQVSSVIFTGAGKVGSENGAAPVPFQISQRADFFECLVAEWTTYRRPLVNSRREALADDEFFARLHCIFFDTTLNHATIVLRTGFMALVLSMLEAGFLDSSCLVSLSFEDPVPSVRTFSHDPGLTAKARLLSGRQVTALGHQYLLLEHAGRFVESGAAEGIVPRAGEIITLWGEVLDNLAARNWGWLARRIDWVAKRQLIDAAAAARNLGSEAPELKVLDHAWSDLEEGLYFDLEDAGETERLVDAAMIATFRNNPPDDTRAFARAFLLRRFEHRIEYIDWDYVTIRHRGTRWNIPLPDPAGGTRDELRGVEGHDDDALLAFFGARRAPTAWATSSYYVASGTNKSPTYNY